MARRLPMGALTNHTQKKRVTGIPAEKSPSRAVRSWDDLFEKYEGLGSFRNFGGRLGAGDRIRTGDIDLGKVALYQLSYSR
jgi:hypothetical protein